MRVDDDAKDAAMRCDAMRCDCYAPKQLLCCAGAGAGTVARDRVADWA